MEREAAPQAQAMTLIERLLAATTYTPDDVGCDVFRRCDQPPGSGRRDTRAILVGLETRDEIVAALTTLELKPMTRDEPYPAAFIGPVGPIHRAEVAKERAEIEQLRAIGLELLAIAMRLAPADYSIARTQIDKARTVLELKSKS